MSLRKGHLRSGMWAPPAHRDEWQDDALCRGMMNDMISADVCVGCPVTEQCAALFDELDAFLDNGTQRSLRMVGTWGGVEHGDGPTNKPGPVPTNVGPCISDGCDREQESRHMCGMHYQRWKKAR